MNSTPSGSLPQHTSGRGSRPRPYLEMVGGCYRRSFSIMVWMPGWVAV